MSATNSRALGVLAGYLADAALGDPERGHPVALFGRTAAALEPLTYRDHKLAGAAHVGLLVGGVTVLGVAAQRGAGRGGWLPSVAATAAATWLALGGTTLGGTGLAMS